MRLSPLNQRRWRNFRRNRRAFWSLVIFAVLFVLSLAMVGERGKPVLDILSAMTNPIFLS